MSRKGYVERLSSVKVNAKGQTLSDIVRITTRLSYAFFVLMYAAVLVGALLMYRGAPLLGLFVLSVGVIQFIVAAVLVALWDTRYYHIALLELDKDPEARRLIEEYSKQPWPVERGIF